MDIFKVSEAAALAFHTMAYLAQEPDRRATTHDIAARFAVSEHHLAKVHQRLVKAGLVEAARGPTGGFKLAKPAEDITLMNIFEVIEGPMSLQNCVFGEPTCGRGECMFGGILESINGQIRDYLSNTTLEQTIEIRGDKVAVGRP